MSKLCARYPNTAAIFYVRRYRFPGVKLTIVQIHKIQLVKKGNISILKHSDTVYLLDASIYIFRAWFGFSDTLNDLEGRSVNAVYGYLQLLLRRITTLRPQYMVAAFDESLFNGFRHNLYPDYKSNRALPDEELAYQLELCKLVTQTLGITCLAHPQYEADDLIFWASNVARQHNKSNVVITRDKDLAQVIGMDDRLWDWSRDDVLDYQALVDHWRLHPHQIADLLALMGDASDNIPGIAGIGKQSATALLQHFGDLETLYQNLDAVQKLPIRGAKSLFRKLVGTREQAMLFRQLTRLKAPPEPMDLTAMLVHPVSAQQLTEVIQQLQLGAPFVKMVERFLS